MKRTAAVRIGTLVLPLVLAMPAAFLSGAAAPATAPSTAPANPKGAASSTPTELLASKGLTKSGNSYVLRAERELSDGLRQIAQAQSKMGTETKNREQFERNIARAKAAFSQLEFERRGYMSKLEETKDRTQQNQLIARINNITGTMKEAVEYKDKQEAELNKVGQDNKTKYINLILDLSAEIEKAQQEYETLNADAEVKSAAGQAKAKLGPSPEFTANAARLKRMRGTVASETVDVKMDHQVPMVEVTLNKSFTRSMVFDSGSSIIAIPADLAKSMELVPGKDDPTIHIRLADGKLVEAKQTMLKSVRVGSFTVENVECAVLPPELVAAEPLLGGSFLKHFTYKLDPIAGKLHLAQTGSDPAASKAPAGAAAAGEKKPAK
jgi:hypothetical protein